MKRSTLINILFTYFVAILIFSCSLDSDKPKDILSKGEMAEILTDFYLKEARISTFHLDQDSALALFQYYKYQYSVLNNMPDSIFDKSYEYYVGRPLELGEIYDRVIDSLTLKEQRPDEELKKVE